MPADILVIEDNPANLELMVYLLRAYGHNPRIATTGLRGIEEVERAAPDLILCDVHLPDVDGFEVARRIKSDARFAATPLIAVTANAMVGDRDRVLDAGFEGYLAKPIEPEAFVSHVEAFLPELKRSAGVFDRARDHATESPRVPVRRSGATLLILDDSQANLDVFRGTCEPFGYVVVAATGVDDALRLARERAPDLIVSDVHLTQESGYDFIRAVKADPVLARIPFVYLSATVLRVEERRIGVDLGAVRFLTRPIDPEVLVAEIEACLREGRSEGD